MTKAELMASSPTETITGDVPEAVPTTEQVREWGEEFRVWRSGIEEHFTALREEIDALKQVKPDIPAPGSPADDVILSFETSCISTPDDQTQVLGNAEALKKAGTPELARHLAKVIEATPEVMALVLAFAVNAMADSVLDIRYPGNVHDSDGQLLLVKWETLVDFVRAFAPSTASISEAWCRITTLQLLRARALYVSDGQIYVNKNMHRALML